MKSIIQKTWKWVVTLLFGVVVALFWGQYYPAHLAYQEQSQLFLFDKAYCLETLSVPGGLAYYVSEFLAQFFGMAWVGAAIVALLFMALQRMLWQLMKRQSVSDAYYPFSFLPILLIWAFLGDENAMFAFPVSLLIALVAAWGYTCFSTRKQSAVYTLIVLPLLYWAAGSAHFVFVGWVMMRELQRALSQGKLLGSLCFMACVALYGLLAPLAASTFVQYSLERLMGSIHYYRFAEMPSLVVVTMLTTAFLPYLLSLLPNVKKGKILLQLSSLLVVFGGGFFLVKSACNMQIEDALQYDQFIRNREWHSVLEKAEQADELLSFSQVCVNLALAKTGRLSDYLFKYPQAGVEGLVPSFQRDFITMMPVSEVYYHLGLINTAQRFTFEAMEAIPNFRKSVRCIKRLAETNLLNGNYEVAAKYLKLLQKTLFYKEWATETMGYLYNEQRIANNREYGWLRKVRIDDDFLFGDTKLDMVLAILFQKNVQNTLAYEYLMAYVLLKRDVEGFSKYYALGERAGYNRIPHSYQEALAYVWMQQHGNVNGLAGSIAPDVLHEVTDFMNIYRGDKSSQSMLASLYGDTFWYYLYYNN